MVFFIHKYYQANKYFQYFFQNTTPRLQFLFVFKVLGQKNQSPGQFIISLSVLFNFSLLSYPPTFIGKKKNFILYFFCLLQFFKIFVLIYLIARLNRDHSKFLMLKKCLPFSRSTYCILNQLFKMSFYNITNFDPKLLTKNHNRVRYDEFDNMLFDVAKANENTIYQSYPQKHIESSPFYEEYKMKSHSRMDKQTGDLPETYGDYLYFTKHAFIEPSNDYDILMRKNVKNNKEELVLDFMKFKHLSKQQKETVRLTKIQLSDYHRYVGFVLDPSNDKRVICGIRDISSGNFLPEVILNAASIVFSPCGKKIYYQNIHTLVTKITKVDDHKAKYFNS